MDERQLPKVEMPRIKLGTQGLEVSRLGFGCMGISGQYNDPLSEEAGIQLIKECFNKGITFLDTADVYGGDHANEKLVGRKSPSAVVSYIASPFSPGQPASAAWALKLLPREKIQVATKFGFYKFDSNGITIKGTPEYVRSCCEASLKYLDVGFIDLYYIHRIDVTVPIEETMGELKKLVEEGKIKYVGLSEASPDTIRRAHAVHPITALQMEYSLWTRDIEEDIIPLCRELGIGIVPYSPLRRGFFAGKAVRESLPASSALVNHPRFTGDNFQHNKSIYNRLEVLAQKHLCTAAQVALAWVLQQGDDVVPIPGTTKIKNLDNNVGSLRIKLNVEDLKEITDAVPINEVSGSRAGETLLKVSWKFANTPPPKK